MSEHIYRTKPDPTVKGMPRGVPFIIGNEVAERFSFYGMKGILVIFMTQHLITASGDPSYMTEEGAKSIYHLFTAGAYFFPIIGALIADILWGKYKTILFISLMYCLGHGMLALMDVGPHMGWWDMKPFLFAGLILIAIGAGGIKPCVSAHVGDQFGAGNKHLITQVFNWFYFAINTGAAASTLLTPVLLARYGPWAAFGLPGVLMAIATFVFWLGRNRFIHVPAAGWDKWVKETLSPEGKRALLNLTPLFLVFVPMFWMLFDQTGSAWVLQGDKMNRELGIVWLPSQIQAINPLLILSGIPFFIYVVYPLAGKVIRVTPLRKIGFGLAITGLAFCVSALIETDITGKEDPIAHEMFVELAGEAVTFPVKDEDETADEAAMRWSRAGATAAQVSGWDDARIARFFDLGVDGDDKATAAALEARFEEKEPFETAAVASMFTLLADRAGDKPGNLNAAVITARNAGWEESQVVGYLKEMPNIIWQFLAYIILTSAEILVSIVCLEFAYTQSPKKMKSIIMGVYFLGVSLGNFYVAGINIVLNLFRNEDGTTLLEGANYYWFFAGVMALTFFAYLLWAKTYKGQTYIQGEDEDVIEAESEAIGPDGR
jgi:proton-dependent oligopeptide transporter, POT family